MSKNKSKKNTSFRNKVNAILEEYNTLHEHIQKIVDLHSKKDDLYYDITNISLENDLLVIDVEYYKWQDTNNHVILIEFELLNDENVFNEFAEAVKDAVEKREQKKLEIQKAEKEKEILKAMNLLKENNLL